MGVTVEGLLRRDAEALVVGRELRVGIRLSIDAGKGYPFEATCIVGENDPAAHINARKTAGGLRRGALCVVTADSIISRVDHGEATYVLRDIRAAAVAGQVLVEQTSGK